MKIALLVVVTQLRVAVAGFASGICLLPAFTAVQLPFAATIASASRNTLCSGFLHPIRSPVISRTGAMARCRPNRHLSFSRQNRCPVLIIASSCHRWSSVTGPTSADAASGPCRPLISDRSRPSSQACRPISISMTLIPSGIPSGLVRFFRGADRVSQMSLIPITGTDTGTGTAPIIVRHSPET